ncbi:MAG: EamA-like transporter family protein, partial [Clostridiales bacterium]|nr:EamA-like transporter family protein [Clostridiales bacterium]
AFDKISMTSIIALVLFGQAVTSLVIDSFGLFHMKKYPFQKYTLIGFCLALIGMIIMLDAPSTEGIFAIFLSFVAGIFIILSRTCNAKLAEEIGILPGSFFNHLTGLPICIALLFLFDQNSIFDSFRFSSTPWIYLGGTLGVVTVLLLNLLVPKVAAFPLTMLSFLGQLFTSMLLDLILLHTYDFTTFFAGLLITSGIGINMILDYKYRKVL